MAKKTRSRRPPVIPSINRTLRPKPLGLYLTPAMIVSAASLWVVANATQDERLAYFRAVRDVGSRFGKSKISDSDWRKLLGDPLVELQPGDEEILEQLQNRMPAEVRNAMRVVIENAHVPTH